MSLTRRDAILATVGLVGSSLDFSRTNAHQGRPPDFKPERSAKLSLLRPVAFVQGDGEQFLANSKKFTNVTGVKVQVDEETWEEIGSRAVAAANSAFGPDIMISI